MRKVTVVMGVVLCVALAAQGASVTFEFSPNEWINSYSTNINQTRLQQDNPRILIDGVNETTDTTAGIHTTYAGASYSSTGIGGFVNRLPSVTVYGFNMWLADGINAPSWGEVLTQTLGSTPSGTADGGWAVDVIDNSWPQSGYGDKLLQWYDPNYWDGDSTTTPNGLTLNGTDLGTFSMTLELDSVDIYGNSVDFSVGSEHTVWLGTMLPVEWTDDPANLVYSGNHRFEGTMKMTVVPEPLTMLAVGSAVAGLGGYIRRRRRA